MRVIVNIDGKRRVLDLTRVRYCDDLEGGAKVLATHPETHKLCIACISFDYGGRIWLRDTFKCPAPYRWCINRRELYKKVYKINNLQTGKEQTTDRGAQCH